MSSFEHVMNQREGGIYAEMRKNSDLTKLFDITLRTRYLNISIDIEMSTSYIFGMFKVLMISIAKKIERIILTFSCRRGSLILQYLCNYVGFLVVIMVQKVL